MVGERCRDRAGLRDRGIRSRRAESSVREGEPGLQRRTFPRGSRRIPESPQCRPTKRKSVLQSGGDGILRGNFGEAILNYERALALDPHHPEAAANLALVRDEARALELKRTGLDRYIEAGTSTQYSIAASIAFWVVVFCATRLFFVRRRSIPLLLLIIFSIVVFAGAAFALYSLETGSRGRALAIVIGKNIEARLATADNANSVLVLPPGSEITVLSQRGDWLYAALPNDLRGWIPANGAQLVRM